MGLAQVFIQEQGRNKLLQSHLKRTVEYYNRNYLWFHTSRYDHMM